MTVIDLLSHRTEPLGGVIVSSSLVVSKIASSCVVGYNDAFLSPVGSSERWTTVGELDGTGDREEKWSFECEGGREDGETKGRWYG
jgi:hypothetical protein